MRNQSLVQFDIESESRSFQSSQNSRTKLLNALSISILICVVILLICQIYNYWLIYQVSQTPILTDIQQINITDYKIRIEQMFVSINQTLNQTNKLLGDIRRFLPFSI